MVMLVVIHVANSEKDCIEEVIEENGIKDN